MPTVWRGTTTMRTCCASAVAVYSTSRPATSPFTNRSCRYTHYMLHRRSGLHSRVPIKHHY